MDINLALQNQLTERQRRKQGNVERIWTPKQIQNAFLETFEMVGGVTRLAMWANQEENYETFLKLLITLAPKGAAALLGDKQGNVIEYRSLVPSSPLNRQAEATDGDFNSGGADNSTDIRHEQADGQGGESGDDDQGLLDMRGDEH
jgi:hypothetical protein